MQRVERTEVHRPTFRVATAAMGGFPLLPVRDALHRFRMARYRAAEGRAPLAAGAFEAGAREQAAVACRPRELARLYEYAFLTVVETMNTAKALGLINDMAADRSAQLVAQLRNEARDALRAMRSGVDIAQRASHEQTPTSAVDEDREALRRFAQSAQPKIEWLFEFFKATFRQRFDQPDDADSRPISDVERRYTP